jgi:hypothetical protein
MRIALINVEATRAVRNSHFRHLCAHKALVFSDRSRSYALNPSLSHPCAQIRTKYRSGIVQEMAAWVFDLRPWRVCAHHTFRWESSLD